MKSKNILMLCGIAASGVMLGAGCDSSSNFTPRDIRTNAVTDYSRVDRMGQPAVATALLRGDPATSRASVPDNGANNERDNFNQGNPGGDAGFAAAFVDTLQFVNDALADDLDNFPVPRCSTGGNPGMTNIDACVAVAAPVVIPDVITLNTGAANGWPNGRLPDDPVVDRILAAVLLDLSADGITLDTLADLPLNPATNDAVAGDPSPAVFPYLRAPIAGAN